MNDSNDKNAKTPLTLGFSGKLELKKTVESAKVRQSFAHGKSKVVTVEVRKKRTFVADSDANKDSGENESLIDQEKAHRLKVLQEALKEDEESRRRQEEDDAIRQKEEEEIKKIKQQQELEEKAIEEEKQDDFEKDSVVEPEAKQVVVKEKPAPKEAPKPDFSRKKSLETSGDDGFGDKDSKIKTVKKVVGEKRRSGKLTISSVLSEDWQNERERSLASIRRARKKEKNKISGMQKPQEKVLREVIIPETITVQELSNRMAERSAVVIKSLMGMGVMATINQVIDADTAQLVVEELGHKFKRIAEADVEDGIRYDSAEDEEMLPRSPVVTVMGHVDHGKTSLLDALRKTDVVAGEAGGITQHIGAYQVTLPEGSKVTFIDTPGHAAFTEMRARGAKVTDLVILVVAANDGIMPQTIEAIRHAKAAKVPIVVAINKIDVPGADPNRVRQEMLQHELVVEELGGDILAVEISAKKKTNLEKLLEAVLLQAEILDLKAPYNRPAGGIVVEAKMEKGRGSVATVLVQRGTLKVGDVFVTGKEWGRVRALLNEHGSRVKEAIPSQPVEVIGIQGTPQAGDDFIVVADEDKAREVASYRQRKERESLLVKSVRGTMDQMLARIKAGEIKEVPVVIKGDVQGSVEALVGTLEKMANEEVKINILHAAVGGINESDVTLARASGAIIIGFNVRANPQARALARRDAVDIRYYSIIYNVVDDLKKALESKLTPELHENIIGYAEVRQTFSITKIGTVAGCMITEGTVKRGAKVRLLRNDVVIHTGGLSQLKRFKDDVREVKEGYECGMSFENYNDLQKGDFIECYEVEEIAAKLQM